MASWHCGADKIFPRELIIDQRILSSCQAIVRANNKSILKIFSLSTPDQPNSMLSNMADDTVDCLALMFMLMSPPFSLVKSAT